MSRLRMTRVFAAIDANQDRLDSIEVAIIDGFKARPRATWCGGCYRLLARILTKATRQR